jgi:hypothetical protein
MTNGIVFAYISVGKIIVSSFWSCNENVALPLKRNQYPPEHAEDKEVTIHVGQGDNMQTLTMFKGILSFYSGYFRSALAGPFIEAQQLIVRLPTVVSLTEYLWGPANHRSLLRRIQTSTQPSNSGQYAAVSAQST